MLEVRILLAEVGGCCLGTFWDGGNILSLDLEVGYVEIDTWM